MSEKFLNLNQDKQKSVIDAAIHEFSRLGYDKASTDTIAMAAGISKGSLFNYFTSKLKLYSYALEYAIELINKEVREEVVQISDTDFYDRLKKISLIKHKKYMKYPEEAQLITTFFINPPQINDDILKNLRKKYEEDAVFAEEYLMKYLDEKKLRKGITKEEVLFITHTLFEALIKRQLEIASVQDNVKFAYSDQTMAEFDKYIEIIKHGIYTD
ncbi:MAG: Transcriptional regulator, TetR/AcrR family [Clostridia bacterium]|jgi:AcrR family transcriptional regulator|nr:Transcriptional regulator, TetR/AcrR family [Clostridia bacterium]